MCHSSTIAIFLLFLTCIWILIQTLITSSSSKLRKKKLPPGPWSPPILGNLHMLGKFPHRSLRELAKKYGPIMSLRLGNVPTIILSSPEAAELFLKTHDANFASRPAFQAFQYMSYGDKGVALAEYGPYWRHVRKLCTLELLCPSKVEALAPLRREEIGLMVQALKKAGEEGQVVDVCDKTNELNEDITYRMIMSCKRDDRFDLMGIMKETALALAAFNLADVVPSLAALDIQGLVKRFKRNSKRIDQLLETILEDHEQANKTKVITRTGALDHKDFVDTLLSFINQQPSSDISSDPKLNRDNVKAIRHDLSCIQYCSYDSYLDLLGAHAASEGHENLQRELDSVIGKDRMVEEVTNDLKKLDYLNVVVKESLRLHPTGPLLFPHESINETTVDGFRIPAKSWILVNVWSIGRDPKIWTENAGEFYPERFTNSNVDVQA